MNVSTMKHFYTKIPDPSGPTGNTMMNQEYHMEPPVTGGRIFNRDGTYLQFTKQYASRDKQFVSTILSCRGSYSNDTIMWY